MEREQHVLERERALLEKEAEAGPVIASPVEVKIGGGRLDRSGP